MDNSALTLQCRSVGLLPTDKAGALVSLLRGMCYKYGEVSQHETVVRVPLSGNKRATQIRLIRDISEPKRPGNADTRWTVVQENEPIRGQLVNDLPASIREVLEIPSWGPNTVDAWISLGCKVECELARRGHQYRCMHAKFEIKVLVVSLKQLLKKGQLQPAQDLTHGHFLIEATTQAPKGEHIAAAKALGLFAQRLLPFVQLRKAEVRRQ